MQPNPSASQLELTLVNPSGGTPTTAFRFTEEGIVIRDNLDYEEWTAGLKLFKWAQTKLDSGFAQYLKFGEVKFGKAKMEESLHQLEFSMAIATRTIEANSVPDNLRHETLQSGHYVVLARSDIPAAQKVKWAKTAADQSLTPSQLKLSIEAGEVVTDATSQKNTHGILNIHGIASDINIWLNRVDGLKGIKKMDAEAQSEIAALIKPIAEIYNEIVVGLSE